MGDEGLEDVDAIESFLAERRAMRKAMPDGEAQAYFGRPSNATTSARRRRSASIGSTTVLEPSG